MWESTCPVSGWSKERNFCPFLLQRNTLNSELMGLKCQGQRFPAGVQGLMAWTQVTTQT